MILEDEGNRGDFFATISTEEPAVNVMVSQSDNLDDTNRCLLQIGPAGAASGLFACAYLSDESVEDLITALQRFYNYPSESE